MLEDAATEARYFGADPAVRIAFAQWPRNNDPHQVLVKVIVLNRLYSTNIYDVYGVRDHILAMRIDDRLSSGDPTLVNDLADYRGGVKVRSIISFASKYCAWHQPEAFQIFDSYVEWILSEYNKTYTFSNFGRFALRHYPKFVSVLDDFRNRFGLGDISRKQIDKFLWIVAKKDSE